MILKIFLS